MSEILRGVIVPRKRTLRNVIPRLKTNTGTTKRCSELAQSKPVEQKLAYEEIDVPTKFLKLPPAFRPSQSLSELNRFKVRPPSPALHTPHEFRNRRRRSHCVFRILQIRACKRNQLFHRQRYHRPERELSVSTFHLLFSYNGIDGDRWLCFNQHCNFENRHSTLRCSLSHC